ncbi:hypothetical protein HBP99_12140 [Listeria booriae]|uniref:hypothetical protein n=1 Tax=Listeria booriae TaxID=1552123 RepID=UPI001626D078|nr:hypothetical protein [Listeria booriae]MBC2369388.1 hypothetical protein [Listeria booriae]
MEMVCYHGTTESYAKRIVERGFTHEPFVQNKNIRLPGDLGCGTYFFLDDTDYNFNGHNCALNYAKKFKNKETSHVSVIKSNIFLETGQYLYMDMDSEDNIQLFTKAKEKLRNTVNAILNDAIRDDGAKKRDNVDGLFIEMMIAKRMINNPDIIVKRTYTAFNNEHARSNYPNGRELVIRNLSYLTAADNMEIVLTNAL